MVADYEVLHEYLLGRRGETSFVVSFAELRQLPANLPASAFKSQPWWANSSTQPHTWAWLAAGLNAHPDFVRRSVAFEPGPDRSRLTSGRRRHGNHFDLPLAADDDPDLLELNDDLDDRDPYDVLADPFQAGTKASYRVLDRRGQERQLAADLARDDSSVEREAEVQMIDWLSRQVGVTLTRRHFNFPDDSRVEIDGVSVDGSILCEAWAHQGPPDGAQKARVMTDAMKLIAVQALMPDAVLVLLFADEMVAEHFKGGSWMAHALAQTGVNVWVAELDPALRQRVRQAQIRQGL